MTTYTCRPADMYFSDSRPQYDTLVSPPYTSQSSKRRVALDGKVYPHIIDTIIDTLCSDPVSAVAFATTSRAWKDRIDHTLFAHLCISSNGMVYRFGSLVSSHPEFFLKHTHVLDILGPVPNAIVQELQNTPHGMQLLRLQRNFNTPTHTHRFTIFGNPFNAPAIVMHPSHTPAMSEHWLGVGNAPPPLVVIHVHEEHNLRRQLSDATECFKFPPRSIVVIYHPGKRDNGLETKHNDGKLDADLDNREMDAKLNRLGEYIAFALHRQSFTFIGCETAQSDVVTALLGCVAEHIAHLQSFVPKLRAVNNLAFRTHE